MKKAIKKPKKAAGLPAKKTAGEPAVLARIAAMPQPFRSMGERLHALIVSSSPALQPTLFYGMPAYAKDGTTVCFFRADKKYMTFGLTQQANLACEPGAPDRLIACAWYFTALDDVTEKSLAAIARKVAG